MRLKWICCVLVMSLIMGLFNTSFAATTDYFKSEMIKLVEFELSLENDDLIPGLKECNGENKEHCNKLLKLHRIRIRVMHWYNMSQKLMAKAELPNIRESKLFRMIIEYFAKSRVSIA